MKIGILTQPLRCNYGGILQNYAMQVVLERLEHEPWTIDYSRFNWFDWCLSTCKSVVMFAVRGKVSFPESPVTRKANEIPLRRFVCKYIRLTRPRLKTLNRRILNRYHFDVLLVGSDQTWRPKYNGCIENMFFAFAEGLHVKRLAYAASFGTDNWEYTKEQESACARLAKEMIGISVREKSGVSLCNKYLGVNAIHVLDPTLLLSASDYSLLCENIEKKNPFVFAYILNPDEWKKKEIMEFAVSQQLPFFIIGADETVNVEDSIEKWLSQFRDAAYVITDSFHGTAFAINFNKDFFVYSNIERGNTRFESLLDSFNLKHRMVEHVSADVQPIDWEEVNRVLDGERSKSLSWLKLKLSNE